MGKDDFWDDLGKAAAIIGGAWILSEIIKGLSQQTYKCPRCHNAIAQNTEVCPHCGVRLRW